MKITGHESRDALVAWAREVQELARQRGDPTTERLVDGEIEELRGGRFNLVIMGKVKRGKSTLCNALLGRTDDLVAPVDVLPASSVITLFMQSAQPGVRVLYRDGRVEETDYARIGDYVTEQKNPGNAREVDRLEVRGSFPGLEEDLVLVDTPGAGSLHKHHDAMLHGFLPHADAVVFLVTARMPVAEDELDLLRELKRQDIRKVFFAINRCDESEEDEIRDGIEYNRRMLGAAGIAVDRIHRISARTAMRGDPDAGGLPDLAAEINAFLEAHKGAVLRERFVARIQAAARALHAGLQLEVESADKSREALDQELRQLSSSRNSIKAAAGDAERRFLMRWNAEIDEFAGKLGEVRKAAELEVHTQIESTPITGVKKLGKDLPTLVARALEKHLTSPAQTLEAALRSCLDALGCEYPGLNVGSGGSVLLRVKGQQGVLIQGLAAGVAVSAAGAGAVGAAGAATAAFMASTAAAASATAGAAAAASAPVTASILGFGSLSLNSGLLAGVLSSLGLYTPVAATTAATVALPTLPVWAAIAGPVGWTLVGVGALVIPFAYRASILRAKEEMDRVAASEIAEIVGRLKSERVEQLRSVGRRVADEQQARLHAAFENVTGALSRARNRKASASDAHEVGILQSRAVKLLAPPL